MRVCISLLGLFFAPYLFVASAQDPVSPVDEQEFLQELRKRVILIEPALYRNKHIICDIQQYVYDDKGVLKEKNTQQTVWKSNADRFARVTLRNGSSHFQIMRPGRTYLGTNDGGANYKITSTREIPENAQETMIQSPWCAHPGCGAVNGLGHGLVNVDVDWYSSFVNKINNIQLIDKVKDGERYAYRVLAKNSDPSNRNVAYFYFDASTYLHYKTTINFSHGPVRSDETDFICKKDDYSDLKLLRHRITSTGTDKKSFPLEEQIYTTFEDATHPASVFQLDQFGLPDVQDRTTGISKYTWIILATGIILGVAMLWIWRRDRKKLPTT
jgi:hypothetical protein